MDDNEIKQMRNIFFPQMKMAEERLESASFILEREANVDAIPILSKAVDIAVKILLSFKKKPLGDFQENIKSLEEEYKKEGLFDKETIESFNSLYEMNESYMSEIELEYDDNAIKSIFEKAENFLGKTYKFLRTQLITPKERMIKRRTKKILIASGIFISSLVVVFFLVNLIINKLGPKHGLLAHYYNNINLKEPVIVERIDNKIDFRWGPSRPHYEINDEFSVRWEGRIEIDKSDNYTFYIKSDEGVRLFLDDEIVIDTWLNKDRMIEHSGDARLRKGFHKIRLEYYFHQRHADIKLLWSSNSFKKRIVGSKVLFPPPELNILGSSPKNL